MYRASCFLAVLAACGSQALAQEVKTTERRMRLALNAPAAQTFPLFGPTRESEWSPEWKPRFLQPADGRQDAAGAVFLTTGGHGDAIWIMTRYDADTGAIDYVRLLPGLLVTRIRIRVTAAGARSTADVVYRLTSLGPPGDALVEEFNASFPLQKAHWEDAINHLLKTGRAMDPHGRRGRVVR